MEDEDMEDKRQRLFFSIQTGHPALINLQFGYVIEVIAFLHCGCYYYCHIVIFSAIMGLSIHHSELQFSFERVTFWRVTV